ncbi:MAG TPA: mechanosensitive ion channel family protein [Terriglobia bacterium]|nr:mechanosensitive ion channel family protein [Terriglobia bacterium]
MEGPRGRAGCRSDMQQFLREFLGPIYSPILIPAIRIGWILIAAYVILKVIDSGLTRLQLLIPSSDVLGVARVEQRTETLRHVIRSVSRGILVLLVLLTISSELGFSIGPVLASAGIVGLAVGFGAQSLVKDVISGFFILFEDQFGVGDAVKIGDFAGVVERMTLRATVLRNLEGQVYVVPNGNIQHVVVMTKGWARAVLDVTVAQNEELGRVFDVLQKTAARLAHDWPDRVLEHPAVLGIEKLDDSGVTIRSIVKTPPFKKDDVVREWRRLVKEEFDRAGIQLAQRSAVEVRIVETSSPTETVTPKTRVIPK